MTSPIYAIVGEACVFSRDTIGRPHVASIASAPPGGTTRIFDDVPPLWTFNPDVAGTYDFRVAAGSDVQTCPIVAVPPLDPGQPNQVFCCYGDSGTISAGFPKFFADALGAQCTLVGTVDPGSGYPTEGYPGKYWTWFRNDVASPLTSGAGVLDIPAHLATLAAVPDMRFWNLGSNDIFSYAGDSPAVRAAAIEAAMDAAEEIVTAYQAAAGGGWDIIGYPWPGALLPGTWNATYPPPVFPVNLRELWVQILREYFDAQKARFDGREAEGFSLCATHLQINPSPVATGAYPLIDAFHFDIVTGHPAAANAMRRHAVAFWPP